MWPEIRLTTEQQIRQFVLLGMAHQRNRVMLEEGASDSQLELLERLAYAAILQFTDVTAYGYSPVLTGTLRSAHRADVLVQGSTIAGGAMFNGTITAFMYIDPSVINPVYGGRPAVYGEEVRQRNDWISRAANAHLDAILAPMIDLMVEGSVEIAVAEVLKPLNAIGRSWS